MELVKLRVYKGKESYDRNGNIISESHNVKLFYNTLEWSNFKKNAKTIFTNAIVEGFFDEKVTYEEQEIKGKKQTETIITYKEKEVPNSLIEEVKFIFEDRVVLSPDQQRIADLEAKIEALTNGSKPKKETKKEGISDDSDDELEALRNEYKELFGKKPNHLMKVETLQEKINEKKS